MNPFNFYGPQFLLFFVVLAAVTLFVVKRVRLRKELEETPYSDAPWNDPYRIAFLRGGKNEVVRVAVVSLVDRGLLSVQGDKVQTTITGRETKARKRIERDILEYCRMTREPKELFAAHEFTAAEVEYENELGQMRLLPDADAKSRRRALFLQAAAVLLFFSLTKIYVALSRGRGNVGVLILFTIIAVVMVWKSTSPRLTARGEVLLENVRNLFASLKVRAPQIRPGGASTELVMLAAVYGIAAVPREQFDWTRKLFPAVDKNASSISSCGSSCGGSCGSSSCGGGGCGGGCGGCGGGD
jgi:uncharacterized protein (TIGR04222 family)